jgi:hypothetical protein
MNLEELKTKLAEAIEQKHENEALFLKTRQPGGNERAFLINRTELNTLEAVQDALEGHTVMLEILTSY